MMDQEKISRLYSELRRESISTGSYPITVRHLESMIRMAEASAKMHLRDYVRSDDIDLAIQVMVGSFVSAQKSSIKKQLQRGFRSVNSCSAHSLALCCRNRLTRVERGSRKYLRVAKDNDEVLAFLLGNLIKDRARYLAVKSGQHPDSVSIRVEELSRKVRFNRKIFFLVVRDSVSDLRSANGPVPSPIRYQAGEIDIHDIEPFFKSDLFVKVHRYVRRGDSIVKSFA